VDQNQSVRHTAW